MQTHKQAIRIACHKRFILDIRLNYFYLRCRTLCRKREKKDVTGNTRNTITTALEKALPQLVSAVLMTYDNMQGKAPETYEVTVDFGEYGAPDFDSRVETVGKASTYGIMSVETQVEELWGSSKEDDWKAAEVKRIMQEKGLTEGEPTAVGDEYA